MKTQFMEIFQLALNKYLDLDPETKSRLHCLENKKVNIELRGLKLKFSLHFHQEKIHVLLNDDEIPDAYISGTPLSLLNVAINKKERHKFFADDVQITGNAEIAQRVIQLFDHLEINWTDIFSRVIGDTPAYHFGNLIKDIKKLGTHAGEALLKNINEYIHEEKLLVPTQEALQDFFQEIDLVRMNADRLEAHFEQLEKKCLQKGSIT